MQTVYLALYKGSGKTWRERLEDRIIRFFTRGCYSHCEIAIEHRNVRDHYDIETEYECYSSSPRDGGVRCKKIDVSNRLQWDLIPLPKLSPKRVRRYFQQTQGKPYDWRGMLGILLGIRQQGEKYFCSEWCFNAIFTSEEGWRFTPNQLAQLMEELNREQH